MIEFTRANALLNTELTRADALMIALTRANALMIELIPEQVL